MYISPSLYPEEPTVTVNILLIRHQSLLVLVTAVVPFKVKVSEISDQVLPTFCNPWTNTVLAPVPAAVSLAEVLLI